MSAGKSEIVWTESTVRADRLRSCRDYAAEADLGRIVQLAEPQSRELVCDVVTGLGHMALALAPSVSRVEAFDPDEAILEEARALAESQGVANITYSVADPAGLPVESGRYDIVTARMALRHTADPGPCLKEMRRVLKESGRLLVADSLAPDHPEMGGLLENMMSLCDHSHVKSYTVAEWENLLDREAFDIHQVEIYPKEHEFEAWAKREGADPDSVRMLALMLHGAAPRAKRHFRVVERRSRPVSFVTWMILILARPRGA